jgi:hypothetical protein
MQPTQEGVIKFRLEHHEGGLPPDAEPESLTRWFAICRALELIGQDPRRYQGAAYGNISQRQPQGFLITGTQTGGKTALGAHDIAWVRDIDIDTNRVISQGPRRPSSESLTHGQLYALLPEVRFIIHVHSPLIWRQARRLGLPATDPLAAYGTPAMAREVERLARGTPVAEQGIISMGGHEDGIVVFGGHAEQAGLRLLRLYRRACALRP